MTYPPTPFSDHEFAELVRQRKWWKFDHDYMRLTEEQATELASLLIERLPQKEYGHGIEIYRDAIGPEDAQNEEHFDMANLLFSLRRWPKAHVPETTGRPETWGTALNATEPALELAYETLKALGIDEPDWRRTFVWQHPKTGEWFQADTLQVEEYLEKDPWGPVLVANERQHELWLDGVKDYPDASRPEIIDISKPESEEQFWKTSRNLAWHFRNMAFEPFTPLWHALNIISHYERSVAPFLSKRSKKSGFKTIKKLDGTFVSIVVDGIFEMGRSYETLRKKPIERFATLGQKISKAQQLGAEMTNSTHAHMRMKRLARMQELVEKLGVSSAAAQCEKEGLGTANAVRRQWYRRND